MKMLLLLVLIPLGANALNLSQAENAAYKNSPRLQGMALEADAASWEKTRALSAHIPHVTLQAGHAFDQKFVEQSLLFGGNVITMPGASPTDIAGVRATWLIFDGLASWNRYEAASANSEAKELELKHAKLGLAADIRTKFFYALGAQSLVEVTNQSIETLEHHLSDVNAQFRGGVSTKFDILRIEVQLEEARSEKMQAQDQEIIWRAKLFEAMGVPDDKTRLEGRWPDQWAKLNVEALKLNVADREDRQAAIKSEEASSRSRTAAMGHWFPEISLYGEKEWYKFNDYDIVRAHDGDAYAVGVTLKWNLFDGGGSYAEQKIAAARAQQASTKLRELNNQIPVEFESWKRRLQTNLAIYKAKTVAIEKAQESVRLAKNGIRAGVRTNTEVLDAELDLNKAKAQAVRAQVESVEALGQLELATGKSLGEGLF